jgi:membrane associated rhomboid family serine protease
VECIREAGGTVGRRSGSGRPGNLTRIGRRTRFIANRAGIVTFSIFGLNVLLYLVQLARPSLAQDWWMLGYASANGAPPYQGVAAGQVYRLLTSAFLPGPGVQGLLDIAFNMWALYLVGPALEQVLGRVRFLAVYLLSAVGGSVLFYYLAPQNAPALGASGAVFGLFAAWLVVARRLRLDSRWILMVIGINLVFSFAYRGTIAWQDHVGGLIVGALITAAYVYSPRKNGLAIHVCATAAAIGLLALAVALRTTQLVG